MSLLDTYRRNAERKREEIAKLQSDKSREQNKLADLRVKIQNSSRSLNSTTSQSTMQSKRRDIERYQKEFADIEKKIAGYEAKIAGKDKELNSEKKRVANEEEREAKKRQCLNEKKEREHKKRMDNMSNKITKHEILHQKTQRTLQEIQGLPERINVLFLASNPIDQPPLRLDEEARSVSEMIRKSKHRDAINFISCWATRTIDILQSLNENNPSFTLAVMDLTTTK